MRFLICIIIMLQVSLDPTISSDTHQFEEMRKKLDCVSRLKVHSQLKNNSWPLVIL